MYSVPNGLTLMAQAVRAHSRQRQEVEEVIRVLTNHLRFVALVNSAESMGHQLIFACKEKA
jgi:hypothetical protein